ncbi:MAG TPA: hypothetical protein VM124_01760 [Candidatus Limnocylindrales bacterium]|nr:hypothetical protein [Candidatus Limnocylindrales bacterium]
MSRLSREDFRFPEEGELVNSSFNSVTYINPLVLEDLLDYKPDEAWGVGDAFTYMDSLGLVFPDKEALRYKQLTGWKPLPDDQKFRTAYNSVRNTIIGDALTTLGSPVIKGVIELSHSGPNPKEDRHYDQVPHLDVVSLLGQRVLLYFAANTETTRLLTGPYRFAGFIDDYSQQPDFSALKEERPDPNQLVRAEGITLLHAGNKPVPNRLFIRAFAEAALAA